MKSQYTYKVSPTQIITLLGDTTIYPSMTYEMQVTRLGKHYLAVPDEDDPRINHLIRIPKKDLSYYIRKDGTRNE